MSDAPRVPEPMVLTAPTNQPVGLDMLLANSAALAQAVAGLQSQITALETRVAALETPAP